MSTANRLLLAVLAAIAAMAFVAASASAQEVEVVNVESGTECSAASANCQVVAEGESHITALPSGAIVSECSDDYSIEWNHDGTGHINWNGVSESAIGCNVLKCVVMNPKFIVHGLTETAAGTGGLHIEFCLRIFQIELECEIRLSVTVTFTPRRYSLTGTATCAGGARRVEIDALTDASAGGTYPMELVHH